MAAYRCGPHLFLAPCMVFAAHLSTSEQYYSKKPHHLSGNHSPAYPTARCSCNRPYKYSLQSVQWSFCTCSRSPRQGWSQHKLKSSWTEFTPKQPWWGFKSLIWILLGYKPEQKDLLDKRNEGLLGETNGSKIGWRWLWLMLGFLKAFQLLRAYSQVCSDTPTCPISRSTSTTKLPVSRFRLESKTHEGKVNFASDKRGGLASRFCCRFSSKWKGKARTIPRRIQVSIWLEIC